jgi:hypothetical protein
MARDNGQGIFSMAAINDIAALRNTSEAQKIACAIIEASSANPQNKKAADMVAKSSTVKALIFGMTNFSLSHQGMPVIR